MYELEAFLSIVSVWAYVKGILRGRRRWLAAARAVARAHGVHAQLGAVPLRAASRVATVLFAREQLKAFALVAAASPSSTCRGCRRCSRRRSTRARPGRPSRASTSCSRRRARCSEAMRRSSRSSLAAASARGWLVHPGRRRARARAALRRRRRPSLLAWLSSQISPAWTTRYFAVVFGPRRAARRARLWCAAGRSEWSRSSRCSSSGWASTSGTTRRTRSSSRAGLRRSLHPGELVISTHPEQVPVLRYYLGPGLRWATTLGPVPDSQVFDWRDAVGRLRRPRRARRSIRSCSIGASGQRVRRLHARLPRLPGLARDLDEARLAEVGRLDLRCCSATRGCGSCGTSRPTRSRSSGTTSSCCRRSCIGESDRCPSRLLRAGRSTLMTTRSLQTTLVLGAGPAGLTAGYLLGQAGRDVARPRGRGPGRRAREDRRARRLPLRSRRPSLLHEVGRGRHALARDPRRRVPAAPAHVPHLLEQPLPRLSAARADVVRKLGPVELTRCMALVPARRRRAATRSTSRSRTGCRTASAGGCSSSSSSRTPRRSGACRRRRSAPSGPRSGSRGSRSSRPPRRRSSATRGTRSRA